MRQVKTTSIKGGAEYAKVADRLAEFRSANPRSKISVKASYDEQGNLTHVARLWKDKTEYYELLRSGISASDALESCEAEGSSFMPKNRLASEKGFEKNETIAIGRALAILGYASSGEIASSEEMEEFEDFKRQKSEDMKTEALEQISNAKTMDELLKIWKQLSKEQQLDKDIQAKKNARKEELSESSKDSTK